MKKQKYMTPNVECLNVNVNTMMATSVVTDDMEFGGNASDEGVTDADVNMNPNWDLW